MIAVERGEQILSSGCTIPASGLTKFLNYRPPLASQIRKLEVNGQEITIQELFPLLEKEESIELTIRSSHGS